MDRTDELKSLTTFDLAFNLAMSKYNEEDKFIVLDIIKNREAGVVSNSATKPERVKRRNPPLKGSKAEKILELYNSGKATTAKEIQEALKKKKIQAYPPEIYRVLRNYTDFK